MSRPILGSRPTDRASSARGIGSTHYARSARCARCARCAKSTTPARSSSSTKPAPQSSSWTAAAHTSSWPLGAFQLHRRMRHAARDHGRLARWLRSCPERHWWRPAAYRAGRPSRDDRAPTATSLGPTTRWRTLRGTTAPRCTGKASSSARQGEGRVGRAGRGTLDPDAPAPRSLRDR